MIVKRLKLVFVYCLLVFSTLSLTGCDWWDELIGEDDDDDVVAVAGSSSSPTTPTQNQTSSSLPSIQGPNSTTPGTAPATSTTTSQTSQPAQDLKIQSIAGKRIIWKPKSDANRMLVVILANSDKPGVGVHNMDGSKIEEGYYTGKHSGRSVYRFRRPGGGYPAPSLLRVGKNYYKIPNPAKRYD